METKLPAKSFHPEDPPVTSTARATTRPHRAVSGQLDSKGDNTAETDGDTASSMEQKQPPAHLKAVLPDFAAAVNPDGEGAAAPTTPSTEASATYPPNLNPGDETPTAPDRPPHGETKALTVAETETASPVGMVRRAAHSGSVSSDLSSSSAATADPAGYYGNASKNDLDDDEDEDIDSKEAIQRRATDGNPAARSRSPYREAGDVPPAPPSTPATHHPSMSLACSFDGLTDAVGPPTLGGATPLAPFIGGGRFINNAHLLEKQQQQLFDAGGATPAEFYRPPSKRSAASSNKSPASMPPGASTAPTPRPTHAAGAATPKPASSSLLSSQVPQDDFSDWAVGDRYELVRILGRGSYGEVAQAIDRIKAQEEGEDNAYVAIKRIQSPFDQQVDAIRLYREIHILRRMNEGGEEDRTTTATREDGADHRQKHHDCIIRLLDVLEPPTDDLDDFHDLYLVFEYVDTDLYKLIMSPQYLTTEHIQTFLYQMLAGLKYIHSFSVIHRDLKPANILLNEDCSLKICDFGLARIVHTDAIHTSKHGSSAPAEIRPKKKARHSTEFPPQPMGLTRQLTKHVVTRWYRAPELILIQPYTSAVDIWSLGCIFAELLSMQEGNVPGYQDRKPLFPGGTCYPLSGEGDKMKADDRLDQLSVIFSVIGTPSEEDIKAIGKANEYIESLPKTKGKSLETLYPAADPVAIDLLQKMLYFNPRRRVTAEEALEHDFFKGVRRQELERTADGPLEGPSFLEADRIDLDLLKQRTYEEVMWYRDHVGQKKPPPKAAPESNHEQP